MKLGFLDFEATSVDPLSAEITEWGLVTFDTSFGQITSIDTQLIKVNCDIPQEVTDITGITKDFLTAYGKDVKESLTALCEKLKDLDFIVAHNGLKYDRPLYYFSCRSNEVPSVDKTWIDTRLDIEYPKKVQTRKLDYLAYEHGFINPLAHRALTDCLSMWGIFMKYPIEKAIASAQSPLITIRADVGFNTRELAKKQGYQWDGDKKIWVKEIRKINLDKEYGHGFKVLELC